MYFCKTTCIHFIPAWLTSPSALIDRGLRLHYVSWKATVVTADVVCFFALSPSHRRFWHFPPCVSSERSRLCPPDVYRFSHVYQSPDSHIHPSHLTHFPTKLNQPTFLYFRWVGLFDQLQNVPAMLPFAFQPLNPGPCMFTFYLPHFC